MAVTLSIGIGVGGDTYNQNYEYSRMAIDLALGPGRRPGGSQRG